MDKILLIIKREFLSKVRNRSFIVMTFLSPLIVVGIGVLVGFLSTMKSDLKEIGVYDPNQRFFTHFKSDEEFAFVDVSDREWADITADIDRKAFYGVLRIPQTNNVDSISRFSEFVSNDSPRMELLMRMERTLRDQLTQMNYERTGMDVDQINAASAKVNLGLTKISGEQSVKGLNEIKFMIGGAFGYLIMMFIIIYGNLVMRSVIEEKTNRIIEIIISSVKPFQLMMGKIIGTSMAGILQFVIWAILGFGLLFVFSTVFGAKMGGGMSAEMAQAAAEAPQMSGLQAYLNEFWSLPIGTLVVSFIVYFIGGYFLYSSFYAAIGAAVDNETDSQQFLFPVIMPLMLAVYIGFFTVMKEPHGSIATIFSLVPLTSPIVMLMRIPFGVPLWQLLLSIVILFATFFMVVWLAAKIYRVGILSYGKKPSWKELYQWLKY